jgi:putative MATE family efflux protein
VARFVGANEPEKVNRTVYQALLTSFGLWALVLAPLGYVLAPPLLDLVRAAPPVKAEALPYLRTMLVFSFGMLTFFMLGGALRSAGDARTPLRLGLLMTVLNIIFNVILIRGLGPIPAFGTVGAAIGTAMASGLTALAGLYLLFSGRCVIRLSRSMDWRPDWGVIRALFRFGLPTGFQGIAMNVAGVLLLRFVGSLERSAEAQAAYAIGYTELFSLITWTSTGLMGATAAVVGQNLGAARPERASQAVWSASQIAVAVATSLGLLFLLVPRWLLGLFGMHDPDVVSIGVQLLRFLSLSGLFIAVALTFTGGLQGTGDTRSPFYISVVSQIVVPLGWCAMLQALRGLSAADIWLAILLGHLTRCLLSVLRFKQEKWRGIVVDIEPARS